MDAWEKTATLCEGVRVQRQFGPHQSSSQSSHLSTRRLLTSIHNCTHGIIATKHDLDFCAVIEMKPSG